MLAAWILFSMTLPVLSVLFYIHCKSSGRDPRSFVIRAVLSRRLRSAVDTAWRIWRRVRGGEHVLEVYYHVADPHSWLLMQCLPILRKNYDVKIHVRVIEQLDPELVVEGDRRREWALEDCAFLAEHYGLKFPSHSDVAVLDGDAPQRSGEFSTHPLSFTRKTVQKALHMIASLPPTSSGIVDAIMRIGDVLWSGPRCRNRERSPEEIERETLIKLEKIERDVLPHGVAGAWAEQVRANEAALSSGHYLPGMISYAWEWFWGVDRLYYLERKLQQFGRLRPDAGIEHGEVLFDRSHTYIMDTALPCTKENDITVDVYWSFRSPYSQHCLKRLYELGEQYNVRVNMKPVLPMVMRGYKVPFLKRMYIITDAKREADRLGLKFGMVSDPAGEPTRRAMCVFPYAVAQGKEKEFLMTWAECVWGEGYDACLDTGLKEILLRSGVDVPSEVLARIQSANTNGDERASTEEREAMAKRDVHDQEVAEYRSLHWKKFIAQNRSDLFAAGLWGVPSFVVRSGEHVVGTAWGNDRLWLVERLIRSKLHL